VRALVPLPLALGVVLVAAGSTHGRAVLRNLPRHHWEDWRFFRHTRAEIHGVTDCFTRPSAWPGLYRPLSTNCYYLAGQALWGNRVEPYHVVNVVLYLANGVLLFVLARRMLTLPLALLVAALWTSRVAHRQLLLYTSEFQALSSVFCSLAALALALPPRMDRDAVPPPPGVTPWREAAALLAFAVALLCKESAIALPAIVSATSWLFGSRLWRRDLLWWGLAAAWAVLFALVLRGVSDYRPTGYAYDVTSGFATRYAAYAIMLSNSIVLPVDQWTVPARVPALARQPGVLVALWACAAALGALTVAARRIAAGPAGDPVRALALGFAWFLAGTAPFVVFADRLFLRYAYFGSAGLALTVLAVPAAAAEWWRVRQGRRAATAAATVPTTGPAPP
jgi:hypothetical protein